MNTTTTPTAFDGADNPELISIMENKHQQQQITLQSMDGYAPITPPTPAYSPNTLANADIPPYSPTYDTVDSMDEGNYEHGSPAYTQVSPDHAAYDPASPAYTPTYSYSPYGSLVDYEHGYSTSPAYTPVYTPVYPDHAGYESPDETKEDTE